MIMKIIVACTYYVPGVDGKAGSVVTSLPITSTQKRIMLTLECVT